MDAARRLRPLLLSLWLAAVPSDAADDTELETLKQQLQSMKAQLRAQQKELQSVEARLQKALTATEPASPKKQTAAPGSDPARPGATAPSKEAAQASPSPAARAPSTAPARPNAPAPAVAQREEPVRVAEQTVKQPRPSKAVETVLQEEHTLFGRRFTLEPGFTYSRFDRAQINLSGFLALDTIFLGEISVDEVEADILTFDLTGRYGVSDRLQVDVNLPLLYRETNYLSGGAGGSAATLQESEVTMNPRLGDVNFGFNYQLLPETPSRPDIVWNLRIRAPTGSDPYGIETREVDTDGNLVVPTELPSGSGLWGVSTGLSFLKTLDPAVLFAHLSWFHNFQDDFDDIGSAEGDQPGTVDLGDAFEYGIGLALAMNERVGLSLGYTQRFVQKTQTRPEGGSFSDVIGSDANVAMLNLGVTFALTERLSMVTSLGAGLTTDAPDVQLGMKFPYSF